MKSFAIKTLVFAAMIGWVAGGGHLPGRTHATPPVAAPPAPMVSDASPVVVDGTDPPHAEAGTITLPRTYDGHFFVSGDVAGKPLRFIVDTGASTVALSQADARAIGVDVDHLSFNGQAQTASGPTPVAPVTLPRLRIGDIQLMDVRALVLRDAPPGIALLGQSFLGRIDKVSIEGDQLTLTKQ